MAYLSKQQQFYAISYVVQLIILRNVVLLLTGLL